MKNMRLRIILVTAFTLVLGSTLTACNTMQGLGQDIEKLGSEIDEAATEKKKYPNADGSK